MQVVEERCEEGLEMAQQLQVVIREVHPYLHSVEGLSVLGGNEPETVYVLAPLKVLPQQVVDQI